MSRAWVVVLLLAAAPARGGVVINEILYHAPEQLADVQFIELHNPGDQAVDLAGWKLARAVNYTFPARATLGPNGYLVVCKHAKRFQKYYGFEPAGQWEGSLDDKGTVELLDAACRKVDVVKYRSRAPWPVSPDGGSPSLERVCPTAKEAGPENWAASPLAAGTPRPGGTPGKKNSVYSAHLPPAIDKVAFTPKHAGPGEKVTVEAVVRAPHGLKRVELLYRAAGSASGGEEKSVPMAGSPGGKYSASIPAGKAGQIVRFRVRATDARGGERLYPHPNELRPALSVYTHDKFDLGKIPLGHIVSIGKDEFAAAQRWGGGGPGYGQPPAASPAARGDSAFVLVDPKTGEPELYDFVVVTPRNAGCKVRFHKDHAPRGMTTINLIYEYHDRFVLAEPLAFDVYRKAGNATPRTDFVRLAVDGRPLGFHLLIEQPNKAFLRHIGLRADGNLYKCQWFGNGLIAQHEKKTFGAPGHSDLIQMLNEVNAARGDKQWELIKKHFDVEQVINYFAVNMVLSHWDGYFNNYFAYHDLHGTGKWTMYPWDQDKTWGFHDGIRGYEVFHDMPVTFGMAGDRPPGYPRFLPAPTSMIGYGEAVWWRPGGHFSRPLLANPTFRKHFLARTKEILEKVYTEEAFGPVIKDLGERVEGEVALRARLHGGDERSAREHLRRNLDSLRDHLKKRREFLLAQDEIKKAGKFDRAGLK